MPLFRNAIERWHDQLCVGPEHPITLIESGPAAGVNGAAIVGELCREPDIIYIDIGGTTAKCSTLHNGQAEITTEYRLESTRTKFGYPVRTPLLI